MLSRSSTHTGAARRLLSTPAAVDIKMPELPASLPRRWETAYIRDKREYKEQVHELRKSYLASHHQRMREWHTARLDEWNNLQATKQANQASRRKHAQSRSAKAQQRNSVMSAAYSALQAQRTSKRLHKDFVDNTRRLAWLSELQSSSHRWVDKQSLPAQLQPSLFDFRIPVPGLTPMRTEREDAMLAYFSSNERLSLPDAVYESLGLAAEHAVYRAEQAALRQEMGLNKSATQEETDNIEDPTIVVESADAKPAETAAAPTESKEAVSQAALDMAAIKAAKAQAAKLAAETMSAMEAQEANEQAEIDAMQRAIDSPDATLALLQPRYERSGPSLRQRMAAAWKPRAQSTFAPLGSADANVAGPQSVAREAISRVGADILNDEESRFEAWYSYTRYLFATSDEQREQLFLSFLNLMLQRSGFQLSVNLEDVRAIHASETETRDDIDAALQAVEAAVQKRIAEAGSPSAKLGAGVAAAAGNSAYARYRAQSESAAAAGLDPSAAAKRSKEFEALRDEALATARKEHAALDTDAPMPNNTDQQALASLQANLKLDEATNAATQARAAAELEESAARSRTAEALVANSTFAALFQELCLQRAKQETALKAQTPMSAEDAELLKKEAIQGLVLRNRHRALAVQLDAQRTLSDAGASAESRSAMRAITSLNDRLEAERRQYRLQTAQREQQLALLGPQDSAARAAIQEAQVAHRRRRAQEERSAVDALQGASIEVQNVDAAEIAADRARRLAALQTELDTDRKHAVQEAKARARAQGEELVDEDDSAEPEVTKEKLEEAEATRRRAKNTKL